MKIISWNVNGIRAAAKKGLIEFVAAEKPDFLCLQETKAHLDQVEKEIQTLGYESSFWSSAKKRGYSGVATFCHQNVKHSKGWGAEIYESEGRIVWTETPHFDLYNIYFPNGGSGEERHLFKQQFLKDLNLHLAEQLARGKSIVLVGDYNVAHREMDVYDPIRLSKESGFLPEEREWFNSFLNLGFVDTFRKFYPDKKDSYSWWSYRELARISNRGWRIDYVCVSKDLESRVRAAKIHAETTGSDHCPVSIEIDF